MRKDHRNLILSIALAGTVVAGVATPAVAAELNAASYSAFIKFDTAQSAFYKVDSGSPVADAFYKFNIS